MKEYLAHVEGAVPLSTLRLRSEVDEATGVAKICLTIHPPSRKERQQLQIILSCKKSAPGKWDILDVLSSKVSLAADGSLLRGKLTGLNFKDGTITKHRLNDSNWMENSPSLLKKLLTKGLIKAAPLLVSQSKLGIEILGVDPPHLVLSGVALHQILATGFGEPYLSQCFKYGLHLRGSSIKSDQRECIPAWITDHCGAEGIAGLKHNLREGMPAARRASALSLVREIPRHEREDFFKNERRAVHPGGDDAKALERRAPSSPERDLYDFLLTGPAM